MIKNCYLHKSILRELQSVFHSKKKGGDRNRHIELSLWGYCLHSEGKTLPGYHVQHNVHLSGVSHHQS